VGCDVVEIDLRRTLDGKIILNHDGLLERLTDGIGELKRVTTMISGCAMLAPG
jgi:glycerophosphoryl diester phosphodiesterase